MVNIRHTFKNAISNLSWMDTDTKNSMLIKLQKMKTIIGYPEFLKNHTYLNAMYSEVLISFLY